MAGQAQQPCRQAHGRGKGLRVEKAAVEGERRTVEAHLGPVRYLATLLGASDEGVLCWFILAMALLLDPAAVLLVLAATRSDELQSRRPSESAGALPPKGEGSFKAGSCSFRRLHA
jgi:hypothetical protein